MQGERPRRLGERTVDYGLAAMAFCEALPRGARRWFVPGPEVEALREESRELLLMIGKSIGTAVARIQGKAIGA
jgi:hypothetical protein